MGRYIPHIIFFLSFAAVGLRIWVAEDAYITFRAIENLYAGHGLVYNPGERVEVFSHPIWMMILVLIRGMGLPLHSASIVTGMVLILFSIGILIYGKNRDGKNIFPLSVLLLISISGFRDFATGGMEFSLLFLFLTVLYSTLHRYNLKDAPSFYATIFSLLYLTRPEMALIYVWYASFFLYELFISANSNIKNFLIKSLKPITQWAIPTLLWIGGYHLFRYMYYGDLFPNTYYAKSGLSSYYPQGIKYFIYSLIWAPGFIILLSFPFAVLFAVKKGILKISSSQIKFFRDAAAPYLIVFYTIRLGGDFMAFRFFLPVMAMLALVLHNFISENVDELKQFMEEKIWNRFSFLKFSSEARQGLAILFFFLLSFWPVPLHKGFVGDERRIFMKDMTKTSLKDMFLSESHPWGNSGKKFHILQDCLSYDDFWITNSQAHASCLKGVGLGYFGVNAGSNVKVLDEQALPSPEIALQPVLMRFRPGHEHYITMTDVITKGAIFCSSGEPAYDRIMMTNAGIIIKFDPELLAGIPDIKNRLTKLLNLKKSGSNIIPRLEKRYNTTLEELISKSAGWEKDPVMNKKNQCWNNFPEDTSKFFY